MEIDYNGSKRLTNLRMKENKMRINVKTAILDFGDYVYSQTEVSPPKPKDIKSNYIFPTQTCLDNELIIVKE